jgi:hypothetical protein
MQAISLPALLCEGAAGYSWVNPDPERYQLGGFVYEANPSLAEHGGSGPPSIGFEVIPSPPPAAHMSGLGDALEEAQLRAAMTATSPMGVAPVPTPAPPAAAPFGSYEDAPSPSSINNHVIDPSGQYEEFTVDFELGEDAPRNATARAAQEARWAMAKERGVDWNTVGGTLQNDILKEFHAQNEFIYPPEASVKLVVDTIEFAAQHLPKWNSVSISGYHIREAGSSATQELAFTLRDGMEYAEACIKRGMPVDTFAPRLSFFFNSHNEFFEEICKLRAARRIWRTAAHWMIPRRHQPRRHRRSHQTFRFR